MSDPYPSPLEIKRIGDEAMKELLAEVQRKPHIFDADNEPVENEE